MILAILFATYVMAPGVDAQTPLITLDALRNATYPIEVVPGGSAKLVNGHFEVTAAPGSASKATADFVTAVVGTLGGQPRAAVVIASSGGGTGLFFELYILDASGATLAKAMLGDRIRVESIEINAAGNVLVHTLMRRPAEPLASPPTARIVHAYGISAAGALTLLGPLVEAPTPAPAPTGNAGLLDAHGQDTGVEAMLLAMVVGAAWAARSLGGRARERRGLNRVASLAVTAPTVDLEAVRFDLVAGALGNARHQFLDVAGGEVADGAAVGADEVVVVVGGAEAIRGAAVVEDDLAHDVEVLEQPQRAEHGRPADARSRLDDVVGGEVVAEAKHCIQQRAPRGGEAVATAREGTFQGVGGRHSAIVPSPKGACQRVPVPAMMHQ